MPASDVTEAAAEMTESAEQSGSAWLMFIIEVDFCTSGWFCFLWAKNNVRLVKVVNDEREQLSDKGSSI